MHSSVFVIPGDIDEFHFLKLLSVILSRRPECLQMFHYETLLRHFLLSVKEILI
jgi:hypothetical protein